MSTFAGLLVGVALMFATSADAPVEMPAPPAGPPVDPMEVIVTVNGTPLRQWQVIEEADSRINTQNARSTEAGLVFDESKRQAARDFIRQEVIHALVERELIAQRLKQDKIEITDADVDGRFAEKSRLQGQTAEEMLREIEYHGISLRCVKDQIRWNTLGVEKLYRVNAKDKKILTDAEALREYEQYPAEFDVEEERRVSHILFGVSAEASEDEKRAVRARAEAALERIRSGEDFSALARSLSEDSTSRSRGGDRGWSARGIIISPTDDPFGNVAFAMKKIGEVSDVVETRDGFHVIQLTGLKPARRKSYDEAKTEMMAKFRYLEIERFWESFGRELWSAATIDVTPAEQVRQAAAKARQEQFNRQVEEMIAREVEKQ